MGKEKEHKNPSAIENQGENQALDPLFCELAVAMNEELRHIRFISTQELRKLHTCHNVHELGKYFETEKRILEYIFGKNQEFKSAPSFQVYIPSSLENGHMLDLIESYTSIDYIRYSSKDGKNEDTVAWFEISVEKGGNDNFYISDIKAVHR